MLNSGDIFSFYSLSAFRINRREDQRFERLPAEKGLPRQTAPYISLKGVS